MNMKTNAHGFLEGSITVSIGKKKALIAAIFLMCCISLAAAFKYQIIMAIAAGLCVKSDPVPCDVICVMGGKAERRVPLAVDMFKKGFGKKLLFITAGQNRWILNAEDEYGVKDYDMMLIDAIVEKQKIDESQYAILTGSLSTLDDARKIREYYEANRFRSAMVITDPLHMRRSMLCFKWCFRATGVAFHPYSMERSAFIGSFADPDDYVNYVAEEYLRLFFYAMGFKGKTP